MRIIFFIFTTFLFFTYSNFSLAKDTNPKNNNIELSYHKKYNNWETITLFNNKMNLYIFSSSSKDKQNNPIKIFATGADCNQMIFEINPILNKNHNKYENTNVKYIVKNNNNVFIKTDGKAFWRKKDKMGHLIFYANQIDYSKLNTNYPIIFNVYFGKNSKISYTYPLKGFKKSIKNTINQCNDKMLFNLTAGKLK